MTDTAERAPGRLRTAARVGLGLVLVLAGTTHFTVARTSFRAQVPEFVPFDADDVVLVSGAVEIALGAALVALPKEQRRVGAVAATFFTLIFPGNLSQLKHRRQAFGLDDDRARAIRLLFQPLLVAWALWSTGIIGRRR